MNTRKITYELEATDTFGGEANYSWVRRDTFEASDSLSNRALVRRAKAFAGFTGLRCEVLDIGDGVQVTPIGRNAPCQTVFVVAQY